MKVWITSCVTELRSAFFRALNVSGLIKPKTFFVLQRRTFNDLTFTLTPLLDGPKVNGHSLEKSLKRENDSLNDHCLVLPSLVRECNCDGH